MNEIELRRAAGAYRLSQAIYAVAELGIADHLLSGPRDAADLARAIRVSEPHLRRLLRALASEGVLAESEDGRFSLGAVGALLASGGGVREMVLGWSVLPAGYQAFGQLAANVRNGRSGFELAHGVDFHAYLATNFAASAAYDAAMESTTTGFEAVAEVYPYGDFQCIVDVGGGGGGQLIAVLQRHQRPHGVVFDLPAVIEGARKRAMPTGIAERLDFVPGNFFEDSLPEGDLYLLSTVLRLFEDDDAVRLMTAISRAMKPGGRVLTLDFVHPPGPLTSPLGLADLQAMVLYGGRDRSEAEFAAIFRRAGLRLLRTIPSEPPHSLMECAAV